jgi:pimeloyl-ACP methyl ester carboxylesterase
MAVYDIADMDELTKMPYIGLRQPPVQSQRERDTMKEITVRRRFYDFVAEWRSEGYVGPEAVGEEGKKPRVLIAIVQTLHAVREEERAGELGRWYEEEHVPLLKKVPGWLRTRRFVTSRHETATEVREYVTVHEYEAENGLGGKEFHDATHTEWTQRIAKEVVKERKRRAYELYYTFGPAPRDLVSLESGDAVPAENTALRTKTTPKTEDARATIESYVSTKDGVSLPYKLEGSSDPQAPLIVLINSILVEWGIWDAFITAFLSHPENQNYRILRYHTRGRYTHCGSQPITLDLLASDTIALLDALRVPQAAAIIGVSLGGATALAAGLKHSDRVAAFMACDTNANSPAGNRKAWGERIAMAEKEGAMAHGESIVGNELAEVTVRRWFMSESYDGREVEEIERVKMMVATNSLAGFKSSVEALFEYDLRYEMKAYEGKGAFLVGAGDGVLPKTMQAMAQSLGFGAKYFEVEGAGHLPMVEKPEEVAACVTQFLA